MLSAGEEGDDVRWQDDEEVLPHPAEAAAAAVPRQPLRGSGIKLYIPERPQAMLPSQVIAGILRALQLEDPKHVFIVRGLKRMGLKSGYMLTCHYSAFGPVRGVLVDHSKVKPRRGAEATGRSRVQPGDVGFVVMGSAKNVECILQVGREQTVNGIRFSVAPFRPEGRRPLASGPAPAVARPAPDARSDWSCEDETTGSNSGGADSVESDGSWQSDRGSCRGPASCRSSRSSGLGQPSEHLDISQEGGSMCERAALLHAAGAQRSSRAEVETELASLAQMSEELAWLASKNSDSIVELCEAWRRLEGA